MPASKPERGPAWLVLPDLQRGDEHRAAGRRGARASCRPTPRSWSSTTTPPTGPARSPTGSPAEHEASTSCTAPTQGRPRPRLHRRLRARSPAGAGLVIEMDADFSHEPGLPAAPARGGRAAPTSCSARATCPAAGSATGGRCAGRSAAAAAPTRGSSSGVARARPDRRLQVLPPRGARGDRPRRVRSRGYAFQVELTYRAIQLGFDVVEVPIVFRDRSAGSSKMSRSIVLEAIWRVPLLRYGR